jgi:hypothetical protein
MNTGVADMRNISAAFKRRHDIALIRDTFQSGLIQRQTA